MTNHKFLTATKEVQQTVFQESDSISSVTVTVNFGNTSFTYGSSTIYSMNFLVECSDGMSCTGYFSEKSCTN